MISGNFNDDNSLEVNSMLVVTLLQEEIKEIIKSEMGEGLDFVAGMKDFKAAPDLENGQEGFALCAKDSDGSGHIVRIIQDGKGGIEILHFADNDPVDHEPRQASIEYTATENPHTIVDRVVTTIAKSFNHKDAPDHPTNPVGEAFSKYVEAKALDCAKLAGCVLDGFR